jgi:hypothetical protein
VEVRSRKTLACPIRIRLPAGRREITRHRGAGIRFRHATSILTSANNKNSRHRRNLCRLAIRRPVYYVYPSRSNMVVGIMDEKLPRMDSNYE